MQQNVKFNMQVNILKVTLYCQLNSLICPVLVSLISKVLETGLNNLKEISGYKRLRLCDYTVITHLQ